MMLVMHSHPETTRDRLPIRDSQTAPGQEALNVDVRPEPVEVIPIFVPRPLEVHTHLVLSEGGLPGAAVVGICAL